MLKSRSIGIVITLALSTAFAVLALLIGVAILAIVLFAVLFFTLIFPRSQDGPVIWERLGPLLICLAMPGTFLVVISIAYFRGSNRPQKAEEDYEEDYFEL